MRSFPQRVISELICLASLSVYFESDLETEWLPKAFMTDASEHGYGVVLTPATSEECRGEWGWGGCRRGR